MNHPTDERIDATLATLRNTPAPTGLEDRLLRTLASAQQRTSTPKQTRMWVPHVSLLRHGWTTNFFLPRLWIPTALAAAAALAITFAIHVHHPSTPTQTSTTAAVEAPSTASTPHELVILSEAQRSRKTPTLSTDLSRQNLSTSASAIATSSLNPYEQAALADALAPSHPAPPLPLTRQERLLLRVLSQGDYTELAELNPVVRSAREARELADFQTFFPSPKPQPQPDSSTQTAPTTPGDKQ